MSHSRPHPEASAHPTSPPLPRLPARDPAGHKGTFGTVAVLGGCARADLVMIGAPALVARAALRTGAGLAKLLVPDPIVGAAISLCPSATAIPIAVDDRRRLVPHDAAEVFDRALDEASVIALGPGLGDGREIQPIALRAVQQDELPIVLGADALNALSHVPELTRDFRAAAVLTPHPGEYRRLAGALNIHLDPVDPATRAAAAEALAQRLGAIVVLKGRATVVSDGHQTWTASTGSSELATAGTGDVLTGIIAGLIAQHSKRPGPAPLAMDHHALAKLAAAKLKKPIPQSLEAPAQPTSPPHVLSLFDCARLAVHAHGLAGQAWTKRHSAVAGLLASELADELPAVLATL